MRRHVDHGLIIELLEDESLSYREIARRASCSDFAVRAIAHKLGGSPHAPPPDASPPTTAGCLIAVAIALLICGGLWWASRQMPPDDGAM
jgi:hypothetical protein